MAEVSNITLPANGGATDLQRGSVAFIGTATTLISYGGITVLTDPNFLHQGEQVHLGYGLKSTRRTNPAISIDQLPPLDLVVLSHMHEDHFDRVAAERLDKTLPIVTTGQAASSLGGKGFGQTHALRTWQSTTITKGNVALHITALPGKHAPSLLQPLFPPVMGSMLEFQTGGKRRFRIYITGDTLLHRALREIPRRYPDIDLALVHLGGTRIFGVTLTMPGRDGVQAIRLVRPRQAVPIHYDDYTVFKSPLSDFRQAADAAGLQQIVRYVAPGETHAFTVNAG